MSTDEEGGYVARLSKVIGSLPTPRQMAAMWTTAQVQSVMATHGAAMHGLGFTMDLAPVLDTAPVSDTIADETDRSFSENGDVAAAYGLAFANGLSQSSVVPVVKHFPGLGHANANTDLGPATDPSLSQLESDDLIPFQQAVAHGLPVVMVSHAMVPGLSGSVPASLSPATYGFLRGSLDFSGVALTDDLAAGAIVDAGYSEPAAAVAALSAGADMAMIDVSAWPATVTALEQAVSSGRISLSSVNQSVTRIVQAKGLRICGYVAGSSKTVSWTPGRLDVFARASDGSLIHKWYDGSIWRGWESLGGQLAGDPAPVVTDPGSLDIFVRGTDNRLWVDRYRSSSGWQWSGLGGLLASAPSAVSPAPGTAAVFVEGADRALWEWSSASGWSSSLGGTLAGPPDALAQPGGNVNVFVEQADLALWQWSSPTGWVSVGGNPAGPPSAVSWGAPRLDVFVEGTDSGLWHAWYDTSWHWEPLGGVLSGPPAAVTRGVNQLDVFVLGTDQAYWHATTSGSGWAWESRMGKLVSVPDAVSWASGRLDVFGIGLDANLWHTWFDGSWHSFELLA
jgi:hypothetical protein